MPSFSKKKGRRRFNPQRELRKAEKILEHHKADNFKKHSATDSRWKYGHLTSKQSLSGSDKFLHKKFISLRKKQTKLYANTNEKSRNLSQFEEQQKMGHFIRSINDGSDISASDNESIDDKTLDMINENDDIFAFRQRNRTTNSDDEYNEDPQDFISSGDDIDEEYDEHCIREQAQNVQDIDIEDEIADIEEEFLNESDFETETEEDEDEEILDDEIPQKHAKVRNKHQLRRQRLKDRKIDLHSIEKQIDTNYAMNDPSIARILSVSKLYHENQKKKNSKEIINVAMEMDINIERNSFQSNIKTSDVEYVESGIGRVDWGRKKSQYYGTDTTSKRFKKKSKNMRFQELRDEELIGMQMQRDILMHTRPSDFYDADMAAVMNEHQNSQLNKKQKKSKSEIVQERNDESHDISDAEIETVEEINVDQQEILKRDHPELPGIIKELENIVQQLQSVSNERRITIEFKFDDAIEDSALYFDLLRTYASVLSFYLQLKAMKKLGNANAKKHNIYQQMLQLKKRCASMGKLYEQSLQMMRNATNNCLDINWNRTKYLANKRKLFKDEKIRLGIKAKERKFNERQDRKRGRILKFKREKRRVKEDVIRKELFKVGEQKMENWDLKMDGPEQRRYITQKIFQSKGLKRYRKQGIPRVKARLKYEKKMKLWKMKGFQKFQPGKFNPNGRGEWNMPIFRSHSKKLS